MPDYQQSKIYKLINNVNDSIYVGSTTYYYLHARLNQHKQCCKDITGRRDSLIYKTMRGLGVDNFSIVLVEKYPCENKKTLNEREQYWINELKPQLNQFNAINLGYDEYERRKKEKREANPEEYKQQRHTYYERNKETLKEKSSMKYTCKCGATFGIYRKQRHFKSIGHKAWVESQNRM